MAQKRAFNEGKRHFKKSKKQKTAPTYSDGSNEEVLLKDVRALLAKTKLSNDEEEQEELGQEVVAQGDLPEQWTEIHLGIDELSSTGDGLAHKDGHVYVVPFSTPGDTVTAKIVKHFPEEQYTLTDFVHVATPSEHRTETPRCQYFSQCSGCQFQHLPYSYQLAHKRRIVEKAYANFSRLPAKDIPVVRETQGSPLQYAYRTKLTPHFDGPPNARSKHRKGEKAVWAEIPPIGYMKKGTRRTMDIEECPIGTEAVQRGLKRERTRVHREIDKYQRGATLLLRESTQRLKKEDGEKDKEPEADVVLEDRGAHIHRKECITDSKATSTEYVDDFRFDNPAGAFFQNNNSILPHVTQYIRDNILGSSDTSSDDKAQSTSKPKINNMIDAYCGSGFFTVSLSGMFNKSIGIDISAQSIDFASKNAKLNNLPSDSTTFIAADANDLFAAVDTGAFPPEETAVVIDPPRKGCDPGFIRQLMKYAPERVCYVSCNVHTQARDVGWLVGGLNEEGGEDVAGMYEIESLRGFDFFPQTSHVEGVAILRKKDRESVSESGTLGGAAEGGGGEEQVERVDAA